MRLIPGARLGVYEVLSPLGAGGMGEVYKARDVRLDRDVAIKVLPTHLSADTLALERFEREAKAVAALSHPNILALHDFGQQESADGPLVYAVMELLHGDTLRDRLARGPLPLRKVLQIGADIADGVAAAHTKGIVHRDLKPENVFVTDDGRVKILDFGLARHVERPPAEDGQTRDGRTVLARTEPGMVMGTIGYMAPEQVSGEPADHRADIFALGCVLYEMAAGRRAFQRETPAETMTAILRDDPPELPRDPGVRPAAFDSILGRCLEKRPDERFQSARDLGFALRSLLGSSSSGANAAAAGAATAARATSNRRRLLAAGAAGLGAVAVFAAGRYTAPRSPVLAESPAAVSFVQVTDQPGTETTPTISADGKTVVYAKTIDGDTDLYSQRVGGRNAVRLTPDSPSSDLQPAFSPDDERIAFRSDRDGGGIFLMAASGESVTRLTDFGYFPTWSPDGAEIAISPGTFTAPTNLISDATGLFVVNLRSERVRQLNTGGRALQPSWSPGGARIAYWGVRGNTGQRDIWTIAADGSDAARGGVPVTNDVSLDWSPAWSPDGRYLYFSSTRGGPMNLWRVRIDQTSGRVLDAAEPVTTPSSWAGYVAFSRDGARLAYASLDQGSTLLRARLDLARQAIVGQPEPVLKGTRAIRDHELSPDGQWVAFTEAGVPEDLFVAKADGTQYRRLTDDGFRDRGPSWSPDGSRIAFYSDRSGEYDLWAIRPDGSGLVPLTRGTGVAGFPVWAPDGSRLSFGFTTWHLVDARSAATASATEAAISPTERFLPASWSADGDRIVGQIMTPDGALATMGVYSLSSKKFSRVPGAFARGRYWLWPVWLADSRRLIVRRPDGIALVDAASGVGRMLLAVGGNMVGRSVGVSHDNKWITYTESATEGDIWIATLAPGSRQ